MTDILLDDRDGTYITLDSRVLKSKASDLLLDCPQRHRPDRPGMRRALVHDQRDGLTINFNRDYPGGVTINDVVELTNRFDGIRVTNVKEITGFSLAQGSSGSDDDSKSKQASSITLRGHIMFEANPEQKNAEAVSLQTVVSQLQAKVYSLAKKMAEMEQASAAVRR